MFKLKKDIVYIEISNNSLFLTLLKKNKNSSLQIRKNLTQNISLQNNEIIKGIICNPTIITSHANKFLEKNKIKKGHTIVYMCNLLEDDVLTKYQILQVGLALSKTNLKIIKIISVNLLEKTGICLKKLEQTKNHFQIFLPPKHTNPFSWVGSSLFSIIFIITIFILIRSQKINTINSLKTKIKTITLCNKNLQEKLVDAPKIKKENILLRSKIEKYIKISKNNSLPYAVLLEISKNIPANTRIKNFKINFSAKTYNEKQQLLEVEGESLSTQEILTFLENLQKSLILENPELTYMERLKQESLYIFKIASTLNAPKNA
jgi:Tfp pilus assembly protein PilN